MVGFNISSMDLTVDGTDMEPGRATGIHYGMIFSVPVSDYFAIQPAVTFSSKGSSYRIDTVDISISPIYIEVPVSAILKFGSDAVGVSIFAGTYFSYGIGGTKIVAGGEAKEIAFGSDPGKDIKHFDVGLNFGAGINIKGFLFSAQYGLGLANLSTLTSANSEMKNRVLGISFTSLFASK